MRVFICGDSTAASYDPKVTVMVGWGQVLGDYLPGVEVLNHAMAGRSTKSFLAEGRLDRLDGELGPGDLLLIQFTHNDENEKPERHTEPWADFTDNLRHFIRFARERQARPVLLTPICMRVWENGALQPTHGEYPAAMRAVAEKESVPLIDLYEESLRIVREAGEEGSKTLFMHVAPGEDPSHPEGLSDNAHTRRKAAELFAAYVAECLKTIIAGSGNEDAE